MDLRGVNLYRAPREELEEIVSAMCQEVGITDERKDEIDRFTWPLTVKGDAVLAHYLHSLRTGIINVAIASQMLLSERASAYAGLLHDIGKASADPKILGKTEEWTESDYAHIRAHVEASHDMLRGKFDFTAAIVIWHHRFQKSGYPESLPESLHDYSLGTGVLIAMHGRVLALADVYDALHRGNARFGGAQTGEQIHEKMLLFNPDLREQVEALYDRGIFTYDIAA